jgi:excisionase family DNA binding protein
MIDRLLTIEEAAERLGRTTLAIYRLVERRKIPFRKAGRRVLFLESELQKFIEALPGLSLEDLRPRKQGCRRGFERRNVAKPWVATADPGLHRAGQHGRQGRKPPQSLHQREIA